MAGLAKPTILRLVEHRATYAGKRIVPNGVAMLVDGRCERLADEELDVHHHVVIAAFDADAVLIRAGGDGAAAAGSRAGRVRRGAVLGAHR